MAETIHVVQDPGAAAIMLHPLRIKILERLGQPASPAALSRVLGVPRQHLNYHVRELEAAGLVEMVEEKRRGNAIERVYQSTARSYVVGPEAMGPLKADPEGVQDRFSCEYLIALGSKIIEDVVELRQARPAIATLALETEIGFSSDAERGQFARELAASVSRLAAAYHHSDGEKFRLVVAVHPQPEKRP